MKYEETPEYQAEIAEQYKERNLELTPSEVQDILSRLGFEVSVEEITVAEAGNMNATFLAGRYVVKIAKNPEESKYVANVVVSEALPGSKVARVLKHDTYEKTDYEVLVMERVAGKMWQTQMPEMSEEQNKQLFGKVLDVVNEMRTIRFTEKFGEVSEIVADEDKNGSNSFSEHLEVRLDSYLAKLREVEYVDQEALDRITTYIRSNLNLFDADSASFVHTDLHMGNVMQDSGELTAVIDFDSVQSRPAYTALISLIGLIDNPAQFVEGTTNFEAYKGKKFEYLYPVLKEKLGDILQDSNLGLKLNVLGMIEGLTWASGNWSKEWTKQLIKNLDEKEIPKDGNYSTTYYLPIIEKIKSSQ